MRWLDLSIVTTTEGTDYKYLSDIFVFGGSASGQPTATSVSYDPMPGSDNTINAPSMAIARSSMETPT